MKPATVVVLATAISAASSSSVALASSFFELQRQLIDKPRRALRAWAVDLALQLGDPQLLMRDQGQVFGRLGSCHRQLRGDRRRVRRAPPASRARRHQRRLQRIDIVRQGRKIGVHDQK